VGIAECLEPGHSKSPIEFQDKTQAFKKKRHCASKKSMVQQARKAVHPTV
jgi:hypothetical protein